MKKIFVAMLALAAATACSNDELVSVNQEAIGFDNAFINNSVRSVNDPSLTASTLNDFAVYGFVEGAVLFDGTKVSKVITNDDLTKSDWKYAGTQYWIAGANYNFNAVAPMTDGGWTKTAADATSTTLSFTNNGTTDLLYALTTQQGKVSGNEVVDFDFRHVLSKVKFSFENAYNATNATIKVKNIKIENAYSTGSVALATNTTTWNAHNGVLELDFGMATDAEETADVKENVEVAYAYGKTYESQNELFLIPGAMPTDGYKVTFDVDLLVGGTSVKVFEHTVYAEFTPAVGNAYDIKAVINAENIDPDHAQEPIEFTVNTLPGWGNTNNVDAE